jgi:hypothetical protein
VVSASPFPYSAMRYWGRQIGPKSWPFGAAGRGHAERRRNKIRSNAARAPKPLRVSTAF